MRSLMLGRSDHAFNTMYNSQASLHHIHHFKCIPDIQSELPVETQLGGDERAIVQHSHPI